MDWIKKNKWKIIVPALIVAILVAAFCYGGRIPDAGTMDISADSTQHTSDSTDIPSSPSDNAANGAAQKSPAITETENADDVEIGTETEPSQPETSDTKPENEPAPETEPQPPESTSEENQSDSAEPAPEGYEWKNGMLVSVETGKDQYLTDPVPEGKPLPVEPEDVVIGSAAYSCTLSISCSTILDNMDLCDPEKAELIPEDGWILEATTVTFYEGESVFNVLQRTCKQLGIHMEFVNTPIYNSAYIEGIHNLYEFDVGENSGWMYRVNGWFPNYGCSRYQLKNGDVVEWVYTCDLGSDVGGGYAVY